MPSSTPKVICEHTDRRHSGLGLCKSCYNRDYRRRHLAELKSYAARYRNSHREKAKSYCKSYYKENREEFIKQACDYSRKNRKECNARKRAWAMKNREKRRLYQKRWRAKPHLAGVIRLRIGDSFRQRIKKVLFKNGKSATTLKLLGCSVEDFRIYLESKFEPGMTWENYGSAWHIDHIMPCAIFDLSRPEHQKRCFHFSNMQPLFREENQAKRDKVLSDQFNLL